MKEEVSINLNEVKDDMSNIESEEGWVCGKIRNEIGKIKISRRKTCFTESKKGWTTCESVEKSYGLILTLESGVYTMVDMVDSVESSNWLMVGITKKESCYEVSGIENIGSEEKSGDLVLLRPVCSNGRSRES